MATFPKDPYKLYQALNERYFEAGLPPIRSIRYIAPDGAGVFLDARHMLGAVKQDDEGHWHMELHDCLTNSADLAAFVMAHEMVHIKHGVRKSLRHGTKLWKDEYRRLTGLGFFERLF